MNYVSVSIFGNHPRWRLGLEMLQLDVAKYLPEWKLIVYSDQPREGEKLISNIPITHYACTRYLACDEADAELVAIRDVDSWFGNVDLELINRLKESSKTAVHAIMPFPKQPRPVMVNTLVVKAKEWRGTYDHLINTKNPPIIHGGMMDEAISLSNGWLQTHSLLTVTASEIRAVGPWPGWRRDGLPKINRQDRSYANIPKTIRVSDSTGIGDTISKITNKLGIPECGGCKKRKQVLNSLFPYNNKLEENKINNT